MRPLSGFVVICATVLLGGCCPHNVAVYASLGGDSSYAEQYQDFLQTDLAETFVRVTIGDKALTAAALAAAIRDDASITGALSMASVVTISIGEHELREARSRYNRGDCGGADNQDCLRAMVRMFDRSWGEIAALVLRHVQHATSVRTMELHHADVRAADFEVMRDYIEQMNRRIHHHAAAWNIAVAPTYTAMNGTLGTDDPVALGLIDAESGALTTKGQERIALALRRLGYAATPEPFTLDGR